VSWRGHHTQLAIEQVEKARVATLAAACCAVFEAADAAQLATTSAVFLAASRAVCSTHESSGAKLQQG
jgi:hypothetical protein